MLDSVRGMSDYDLGQVDVKICHLNIDVLRNHLHTVEKLQYFLFNLRTQGNTRWSQFASSTHSRGSPCNAVLPLILGSLLSGCNDVDLIKSLRSLVVDVLPGFFLDFLLLFKRVSVGSHKILLRLSDPLKLSLYN